jgi:ribosome biogenesis GTPase
VCGDRVLAHAIDGEPEWLITEILPRKNELTRPDRHHRVEVLAANISLLAVVSAATPPPDWFIVDRYLAAAEFMQTGAVILFNKSDLEDGAAAAAAVLAEYRHAGYTVISCSASAGSNLDAVQRCLRGQTAIIVGQSGVGKSTLINMLAHGADQATAELSQSTGEGQHTTVNSVMWSLPDGGAVIDSPGVRDFAPAIDTPEMVAAGFREIDALAQDCRFANCRHLREPDCAVKAAVQREEISERRYESYRRLLALSQKLSDNHN